VNPLLEHTDKKGKRKNQCCKTMQYNKSEGFVKSLNLSDFWNQTVDYSVAAHDTTGGMETKISEAAMIAKLGVDVYIVKVDYRELLPLTS